MRSNVNTLVAMLAGMILIPQLAIADDIEETLRSMQERLGQIESELQATRAELATQRQQTEAANQGVVTEEAVAEASAVPAAEANSDPSADGGILSTTVDGSVAVVDTTESTADKVIVTSMTGRPPEPEERGAVSALSSFLDAVEFGGWIAASYNYNFRGTGNDGLAGQNVGAGGIIMPTHPDNNSFSLDQLWFEVDKPASEDSRAGFHIDWLFGKTAEVLGGGSGTGSFSEGWRYSFNNQNPTPSGEAVQLDSLVIENSASGSGDSTKLFSAYITYLAPLFRGVRFDVGKIPTLIGAEVVQAPYNFNVTRGLLWSKQPTANVGVMVGTEIIAGFSVTAGFLNDVYSDTSVDLDNNKAMVGQLKYEADFFSVAANVTYGSRDGNGESDKAGIGDLVVTWDPLDDLSLWLNFDVFWFDGNEPGFTETELDGTHFGVGVAGRYAITDRWGASVRFEWLREDPKDYEFDAIRDFVSVSGESHRDLYEFTFTSDFALTNHLQLRGEVRYDWISSDFMIGDAADDDYYINKNGNVTRDDQVVALAELIYSF